MNSQEYDGQNYILRNGTWYDSSFFAAPKAIQNELNALITSQNDFKSMALSEIINMADGLKANESYSLALKAYNQALERSTVEQAIYILPRITSCYRSTNQPKKAIDINHSAKIKFGNAIITPVLLTSIAAAFCDVHEYEKAKRCCDKAYAMSNGKASAELALVYKRIRSVSSDL